MQERRGRWFEAVKAAREAALAAAARWAHCECNGGAARTVADPPVSAESEQKNPQAN